jgi:hypothetical protein
MADDLMIDDDGRWMTDQPVPKIFPGSQNSPLLRRELKMCVGNSRKLFFPLIYMSSF